MVVVPIEYSGEYLEMSGEEFGKDVTGFVCIPIDNISAEIINIADDITRY